MRGRSVSRQERRNLNLAFVLDRSRSMGERAGLESAKRGLLRALPELKSGDIVHVELFERTTCSLVKNFVVGRDSLERLEHLIRSVQPRGASNLGDGLRRGYDAVNQSYQPEYSNRVLVLTDSTPAEVTADEALLLVARHHDARRVRLSTVALGVATDDGLLERLSEAGKGSHLLINKPQEVDFVFGERFVSLVEPVAANVHFRLELPRGLSLSAFYGEEASSEKGEVQALHFSSGTSQLYLSNLQADGALPGRPLLGGEQKVRLAVEYEDPRSGQARVEHFSWTVREIEESGGNLAKARLVATFGYQLRLHSREFAPYARIPGARTWMVPEPGRAEAARAHCERVELRLEALAAGLGQDGEVERVRGLWRRYCRRFP